MKETFHKFLYSNYYIAMLSIFTILSWYFKIDTISFSIIFVILFLEFLFLKDTVPTIPVLLHALFLLSNTTMDINSIPTVLYLAPIVVIVSMCLHMILRRQHLFQGKLKWSIVILFIALVGSYFNSEIKNIQLIFYSVIGLSYAFIYFLYVGSIKSDAKLYLLKIFFSLSLVISIQILLYYISVPDLTTALENKTLKLGWGISNYAATYLILFSPSIIYFAKKSANKILFLTLFVFTSTMLLFTLSRAGIIAYIVIIPLLIFYFFHSNNWKNSLINFGCIVLIFVVIYLFNKEPFDIIIDRMLIRGLDDSGRIEIWKEGIQVFFQNPIFGKGLFARFTNTYKMYHNTFIHTIATLGLVGLMGLLLQLKVQFLILLKDINKLSRIFLIGLFGVHLHGIIDNVYFMPQFMIVVVVIVSVFEYSNNLNLPSEF